MGFWYYFWTANFIVSASAFLIITLIVMVRGTKDLEGYVGRVESQRRSSLGDRKFDGAL